MANPPTKPTRPTSARQVGTASRSTLAGYPPALVEATLDRLVASSTFRRSQRHRRFLAHLVRAALAGEHERLKEVVIGIDVFGRSLERYDPRRDPIVRVEAGRVREKLARFYADEGAEEPFEIGIPIGSYVPTFSRRRPGARLARPVGSLAVLPFTVLSDARDDEAMSAGLSNQMIDTLGRISGLKVVARFSASKAMQDAPDVRTAGKLLGVTHVVDGSIQRGRSRVRCIAQLSRTRDGLRIWSGRFEHDAGADADWFRFQDQITDAVFEAVMDALFRNASSGDAVAQPPAQAGPTMSTDTRARDLYERARYLNQQGTIEAYRRAIELLERAVAIDPTFAQAHSHLGAARANLAPFVFAPAAPSFAKVREAAMRALELDPLDGDARALLAVIVHRMEGGWAAAEPMFREALRLAPSSMLAHTTYSWGLVFNGQFNEAMQHARTALELDPLNLAVRAHNARLYSYAREPDLALAELNAVLDLDPAHLYSRLMQGMVQLSVGALDEALAAFDRIIAEVPDHSGAHFYRVCALGLKGEVDQGRVELKTLLERLDPADYSLFNVALAQACMGDDARCFESLDEAGRVHDYLFVSMPAQVLFDRYRDDPRYLALIERYGLPLLPPWPDEQTAPLR